MAKSLEPLMSCMSAFDKAGAGAGKVVTVLGGRRLGRHLEPEAPGAPHFGCAGNACYLISINNQVEA